MSMRTIYKARITVGIAVLAAAALTVLAVAGGAGAAAAPDAKKQAGVTIKNFAYHKKTLRVAKGTKVVFRNKDASTHTATKRGVFNTGKIKHNKAKAVVFKHKGTFRYICTLHPFMKGKVVVG